MKIQTTPAWLASEMRVGVLHAANVRPISLTDVLEPQKRLLEADLQRKYAHLSRAELLEFATLAAYQRYYRQFDQTYHLQLQLESVIHKNKRLPKVHPLVDATFLAELESWLLTATHDADTLLEPLTIDLASGQETIVQLGGKEKTLTAGDTKMSDSSSAICSILHGQTAKNAVSHKTSRALFVVYAPPSISSDLIKQHLTRITELVALVYPKAQFDPIQIYGGFDAQQ